MTDACCDHDHDSDAPPQRLRDVREIQLSALAGLSLAIGLAASAADLDAYALAGFAAAILAGGLTFIPQAARGLLQGRLSVGTLMAIAAIGAVILGEWGEAATLAFLFSISEALESYALTRTRRGLRALLDLVPARATVLRDGRETTVGPDELRARRPTRGQAGRARGDRRDHPQRPLGPGLLRDHRRVRAGRAQPRRRGLRGSDQRRRRARGRGDVANRGQLARPHRARSSRRPRSARATVSGSPSASRDRWCRASWSSPFLIAVIGSLLGDPATWIERSLVVLVAAAPCAFAISVPVTVVAAIGAATRSGVLIKGGAALEALGSVRAVALDKTGTLTRNRPTVVDTVSSNGARPRRAARSGRRARAPQRAPARPGDPRRRPRRARRRRRRSSARQRTRRPPRRARAPPRAAPGSSTPGPLDARVRALQGDGATVVLVERDGETLGAIAVRDELRPDAPIAVRALHDIGMQTCDAHRRQRAHRARRSPSAPASTTSTPSCSRPTR